MHRLSHALVALCLVAAVWRPAGAMAHGVGSRELDPGAARAMVFLDADGEAMAFAQVQVTAPDGTVHQSARTDGRGGFAFLPSASGVWRVAASDGQGHRAEREVAVGLASGPASPALAAPPAPGPVAVPVQAASTAGIGPNWRDVALGLSLLANLGLGAACLRRRGR